MNRGILVFSTAALISAAGIVAVSNTASAETVNTVCASSGPGSGSWVISADANVPDGVVISSVSLNQRGATVTEGVGTRQVQVQYVGDALSGSVTFSDGETDGFAAEGDCAVGPPPSTSPPRPSQCPDGPPFLHGSPPITLATIAGPGTVTVTGQTTDSHPGHSTQGQTGEQIAVFAVPTGGGSEIVIIAATDDVPESSDDPPPVPFDGSAELGSQTYSIVVRHVGGPPLNSVCVSADVTFRPPSTTTTTTTTTSSTTTTTPSTTTTTPSGRPFSFSAVVATCPEGVPTISITFSTNPELDGQVGTLVITDSFGELLDELDLTFESGATVEGPYPDTTEDVVLIYTLGEDTVTAEVPFPVEECPPGTTTTVPGATTTTLPETFDFGAATTVCVAEVPTIRITFQNLFPELAGETGTLTMSDIDGNVVSTQSLVYQPGTTVDLLYPGTSVNPDGSIDDVPGWILTDDGFWVLDPSDEFLREGINLSYTVNPTATAFVTYPPESSACADPDGPFPPGVTTPPGRLPSTH